MTETYEAGRVGLQESTSKIVDVLEMDAGKQSMVQKHSANMLARETVSDDRLVGDPE